ncbi:MAG: GNAT family N-acetyltransferase [Oscillospiraceae bacterium]|nr:GNAT family N-acetyltransferase [Oscillospiraceae bacterium]
MCNKILTDEQSIDYIVRGGDYWQMLGSIRGSENHHQGNLSWVSGHVECAYSIKLEGPDYNKEVEEIIRKVEDKEIPYRLIITPNSAPPEVDVCGLFLLHNNFDVESNYGMIKELSSDLVFPALPQNVNLFRVNDIYQLKSAGSILNSAFEYDFFSFEHYLDIFNIPSNHFYLAECDGIPAGALMAIHNNDLVEISWVGTLKGYRKKGIAKHLIHMAEKDAIHKGISISTISAFADAANAYINAGYRKCCEIKVVVHYTPAV